MNKKIVFISILLLSYLNILDGKLGPDYIVIGVTKCGTTSLYSWLIQHPQIHKQEKKEVHFFDSNFARGMRWYGEFFSKKIPGQLSGEATPGYFWKKGCVEKIAKHCSGAKLILICRNPVKRVISEYFRLRRRKEEWRSFEKAIANPAKFRRYIGAGCYSEHLAKWFSRFPRERMHIMFLEELAANPEEELNKVFRFLGLKNYRLKSYEVRNKATYDLSQIKPETVDYLKEFYKPFNQKLERMLKRKLPWES